MVEPQPGRKLETPTELSDAMARGETLWDLAQKGSTPPAHTPPDAPGSRASIVRLIFGVVGVLGLLSIIAVVVNPGSPVSSHPGAGGGGANASSSDPAGQAPGPASTSGSLCSVEALNPHPSVGTSDALQVSRVPPSTVVIVDLAFPGGSARYSVTSTFEGVASVLVAVNSPPSQPVEVTVTAGASACTTSLTPTEKQQRG